MNNQNIELRENAIPKKPRPYKKLFLSFPILEELDDEIDALMNHIRIGNGMSEDCYRSEIEAILKYCLRSHHLTTEQYEMLKSYYVNGGLYEEYGLPYEYDKKVRLEGFDYGKEI